MRLRSYILNEASFGNKSLEKAVKLILKTLESKVGSKFYPFGGQGNNFERFSKSNGNNGIGMIYVLDYGTLVRFNWEGNKKSSTLSSIDVWKDMKNMEHPDFNLDIPVDYNIVQSINLIANFIKSPTASVSEMAAKGQYGQKRQADAEKYGIDIDDPKFVAKVRKAERKAGIGIKSRKGVKEKSTSTNDVNNARKMLKGKKIADPSIIFQDLEDLIKMVGSGIQKSLMITGMAGIGKTYTVTTEIEKMLGPQGDKWTLIKGKTSPLGLYSSLFLNRDKLIVFDDIDSVFKNKDTVNMLKAALDSYDKRVISWISPITVDVSKLSPELVQKLHDDIDEKLETDPLNAKIKYPNTFEFTGRVIFISNIHESKMDKAIKSRSFVIDITLKAKDVFNRMKSIINEILPNVTLSEKQKVLEFLKEKSQLGEKDVDIRTLINGIKCKQSGSNRWEHLAEFYA